MSTSITAAATHLACSPPTSAGAPPPAPVLPADADIARAVGRVHAALLPTPALWAPARDAWLKLDNLQVTGSYKVRGALNALAAAVERGDRRPVVAASAGNHGLGVAWAARHLGLAATVLVPHTAPANKLRACRALGARVLVEGQLVDESLAAAQALAARAGARFVHAFDDPEVIAGQATLGVELAELRPDVVLVPVGGGGLASGVGLALRHHGVRVVGVQVAGADAMRRVLAGAPPLPPGATLADGMRVAVPGRLTRAICRQVLDDIVVVDEDEVAAAVAGLALADRIVAEGAGAAAVAALARVPGRRRVAVVSGGNIEPAVLSRLMCQAEARGARVTP
jgi:threonine dehydratase